MYKAESLSTCYDVLVLGSGIAGLLLADLLSRRGMSILLACKGKLIDSNTTQAQGGLAAVVGTNPIDSPELHWQDTLSSGAGLTDEAVARMMVSRGSDLVKLLATVGVNFDKKNGAIDMALEGGHSRARVLHSKDASGRAISTSLIETIRSRENLTVWEDAFALDLIVDEGRCAGVTLLARGTVLAVRAAFTVLATGGLGQVFSRTTNPSVATGDGIAMAYRCGARLMDMEFVQFHPTALSIANQPADLVSEAVRGAGATLLDQNGQRFAFRFHKEGELATRDIVARGIYTTMLEQNTDHVLLDMSPIGKDGIGEKFPNILKKCLERGFDPRQAPIPIAPAAHYFMGGIWTDITGGTTIPGLFAIGECASTGLHGANRLASNSLLEGGVMAMQVAETLSGSAVIRPFSASSVLVDATTPASHRMDLNDFRSLMFKCVGLERNAERLQTIVELFENIPDNAVAANRKDAEHANIELLGWLIASSALERAESRGAHWRSEYPATNNYAFRKRRYVSKEGNGWIPVAQPHVAPAAVAVNF